MDSLLLVGRDVVQADNDKQQVQPMLEQQHTLPDILGTTDTLIADAGDFSTHNVDVCVQAQIEPLIESYGPERLQKELAADGFHADVGGIKRLRKSLGIRCKHVNM